MPQPTERSARRLTRHPDPRRVTAGVLAMVVATFAGLFVGGRLARVEGMRWGALIGCLLGIGLARLFGWLGPPTPEIIARAEVRATARLCAVVLALGGAALGWSFGGPHTTLLGVLLGAAGFLLAFVPWLVWHKRLDQALLNRQRRRPR